MIANETLAGIHHRLAQALAPPAQALSSFEVNGSTIGWITADRVPRVTAFADVFVMNRGVVHFVPALGSPPERTAAMAYVAKQLDAEGALTAWRDERYAVAPSFGATPLFLLERAAARYFGVHTYAAHVNGLVREAREIMMWLARRSATKAIDPGMLDNLVGGGIAVDTTVAGTVAKESWEEAGIPPELAATARPGGTVGIFREQPDGIQHETIFVHDLRLPIGFAPANQDGEAVEHRRVTLPEAARLIAIESGPEAVTADAALVALDCLLRYGAVPADSPYHAALAALRRHSG